MPMQRCLNDSSYAFNTEAGCPTTGCYRNDNGTCVTTLPPITSKQMAAMADAASAITNAISLTQDFPPAVTVEPRTSRFYAAKRNFFVEADITEGQLQTALLRGIDWISMLHSSRVNVA